jgi:cytochrome c peroxidase
LELPTTPYSYDDPLPAHFQSAFVRGLDNTPVDNPITADGATLGRVLFYATALSANDTVSCATCHQAAAGFTDPDRFSTGFAGALGGRNAMSLADARFVDNGRFFWDQRAPTLEAQVLAPIQDPLEMGRTLADAEDAIAAQPWAAPLFERAFGTPAVTADRISRALAQFIRSLASYRSRYDQGLAGTVSATFPAGNVAAPFATFSAEENRGKELFLRPPGGGVGGGGVVGAGCAACHLDAGPPPPPPPPGAPPPTRPNQAVFLVLAAVNNGLDATAGVPGDDIDDGVGDVTGRPGDVGRFKSPSLRNVALTAPYMHDGRLATLDDVIDHYDHDVQPHPNLDGRLRAPPPPGSPPNAITPRRLNLTAADKAALKAFLLTLTDEAVVDDVRFRDPFR